MIGLRRRRIRRAVGIIAVAPRTDDAGDEDLPVEPEIAAHVRQERHRLAIDAGKVASGGKALTGEALGMRPPGRRADLHRQTVIGRNLHVAAIDGSERPPSLAVEAAGTTRSP